MSSPETEAAGTRPRPLLGTGLRRPRPGRQAYVASLALHLGIVALFWVSGRLDGNADPRDFVVYRVNIVSPPPQALGEYQPVPPAGVETQAPVQETAKPEPPKVAAPKVEPKKAEPERRPTPPKPQSPGKSTGGQELSKGNNPQAGSTGGEGLNVQMEGVDCPSPGYCENIIRQVNRHFRWTAGGNLAAVVYFVIQDDGSVEDVEVTRGSGNTIFDLQVKAAVEAAGRRQAFGRLPRAFGRESLPIEFTFSPPR